MKDVKMQDSPNSFPCIPADQTGHLKPFLIALLYCSLGAAAAYLFLTALM